MPPVYSARRRRRPRSKLYRGAKKTYIPSHWKSTKVQMLNKRRYR